MDRYKIALVSDWYSPRVGGLEMLMRDLAQQLHLRGHEVHVYTTTPGPETSSGDSVFVHRLKIARVGGVATPNLLNLSLARRIMRRERFDVVHAHGLLSIMAIGVLMSARAIKVPCVLTSHSLLRGGTFALGRAILAAFTGRTDVIAGVSRAAADDVARASRRNDVIVLSNGVDPSAWATSHACANDGRRVAAVMRLTRKRNAAALIGAIPYVLDRVSGDGAPRFTIVGDGPERLRLERQVARLGLGGVVEFLGQRTRQEVAQVLATSAIFALPCRYEAFGLAALEARCAGVPIVAMRGGGIGEIVEDGRHGYVTDTPRAFADAIVRLLTDEQLRTRMRRETREGLGRFEWDEVIRCHIDAYRLAMSGRSRGRGSMAA